MKGKVEILKFFGVQKKVLEAQEDACN